MYQTEECHLVPVTLTVVRLSTLYIFKRRNHFPLLFQADTKKSAEVIGEEMLVLHFKQTRLAALVIRQNYKMQTMCLLGLMHLYPQTEIVQKTNKIDTKYTMGLEFRRLLETQDTLSKSYCTSFSLAD